MSLDLTYQVTDTTNQDSTTTMLICEDAYDNTVMVEVNPTELFINMVENLGDDMSHAQAMVDWLNEQL